MPASITLTVAHLPTSTSFFLSVLQPLNYIYRGRVNNTVGFGPPDTTPDFWITQSIPGIPPGPAHVAFPALSRAKVHEFFQAALKAGGKVHGEPALRDECGYYSAAVIDLDGNSIEAVFRPDLLEANKENVEDAKSAVSMAKSTATSKAPSHVSSASKARSTAPSKAASVAPSASARSSASKAPSQTSSAATSRASTTAPRSNVSRASTTAPRSTVSRTSTAPVAPSEVPARTTITRTSTAPAAPQSMGNNITDILNEARTTVNFARELVNQARPMMSSSTTAPSANASGSSLAPDSHGSSDAIVGTLLGVAAGAALHYAYSNLTKPTMTASAPVTPPDHYTRNPIAPSESAPSWTQERFYYYHQGGSQRALPPPDQPENRPYAIEAPPTEVSYTSQRSTGQRLLLPTSASQEQTLSDIASSTIRPHRRSSFSAVSIPASAKSRSTMKALEGAPPTSYHAPTAITMQSSGTKSRRSRASSLTRSSSHSHSHSHRATDEGYASATESRKHRHHKTPSSSTHSRARTTSKSNDSVATTAITAIRNFAASTVTVKPATPSETPLPPSRAASHIDDRDSFYTMHSRAAKTVIGRLTEKQLSKLEEGGRLERGNAGVSRSVVEGVKGVDGLDLSRKELRPEDSVSQVSSRGSRRSKR